MRRSLARLLLRAALRLHRDDTIRCVFELDRVSGTWREAPWGAARNEALHITSYADLDPYRTKVDA